MSVYRELSDRIQAQVPDLDRVVERALAVWERLSALPNLWPHLRAEIVAFATFLDDLSCVKME